MNIAIIAAAVDELMERLALRGEPITRKSAISIVLASPKLTKDLVESFDDMPLDELRAMLEAIDDELERRR